MNYQVEFTVPELDFGIEQFQDSAIRHLEKQMSCKLGQMISDIVGFNKKDNYSGKKELRIVAFDYDDWVEFKRDLKQCIETASELNLSTFNLVMVAKMINKLELIGKDKIKNTVHENT